MTKLIHGLLAGTLLAGAAGCSVVLPTYEQPAGDPRAKVRVIYSGGGAKFHPGKDCQIGRNKFGLDVMGARIPGFGNQRKLGMPLPPDGGFYDEVYVRAGEPLTAHYVHRAETSRGIEECAVPWFTFVPEENANYEMAFSIRRNVLGRLQGCDASLARIVAAGPGAYRREAMAMRSPAAVRCSK